MGKCFVIQPFDGSDFDNRFDDVIVPAIRDAELEPYRVDRDPSTVIPIEDIEAGIRSADACLADVSKDNPNVWFEVGYSIATHRPLVLLARQASDRRLPFDIQHRHVIFYRTESVRDFEHLREEVTERLRAVLLRHERIALHSTSVDGLPPHELAALTIIGEREDDNPFCHVARLTTALIKVGYTKIAVQVAVEGLKRRSLIESRSVHNSETGEYVTLYQLTETGSKWLVDHHEHLVLRRRNIGTV